MSVIQVEHLHKTLRQHGRRRRRQPRGPPRRDLRRPRPQRGRQDHHRRDHRRPARRRRAARSGSSASTRSSDRAALRQVVGLQLQESQLQPRLGVREALDLYASFYPDPADPAQLLDELGLTDRADARFEQLSGGQKQRLSVALALVGNPQVAILDELTTGLDPHARRDTWEVVERIRDRGVTIVLVTHLMEEAERLCDRIALIDAGPRRRDRDAGGAGRAGDRRAGAAVPAVGPRARRAARAGRRASRTPTTAPSRPAAATTSSRTCSSRWPSTASAPRTCASSRARSRTRSSHSPPPRGGLTMSSTTHRAPRWRPRLTATEARLFLREPSGAFFAVLFPAVLLTVLGLVMPWADQPFDDHGPGPVPDQRHHRLRADRPGARGGDRGAVLVPADHRGVPRPRGAAADVDHPGAAVAHPRRAAAGEPGRAAGGGRADVRGRRRRRGRGRTGASPWSCSLAFVLTRAGGVRGRLGDRGPRAERARRDRVGDDGLLRLAVLRGGVAAAAADARRGPDDRRVHAPRVRPARRSRRPGTASRSTPRRSWSWPRGRWSASRWRRGSSGGRDGGPEGHVVALPP